jgi:hypothetical protein
MRFGSSALGMGTVMGSTHPYRLPTSQSVIRVPEPARFSAVQVKKENNKSSGQDFLPQLCRLFILTKYLILPELN